MQACRLDRGLLRHNLLEKHGRVSPPLRSTVSPIFPELATPLAAHRASMSPMAYTIRYFLSASNARCALTFSHTQFTRSQFQSAPELLLDQRIARLGARHGRVDHQRRKPESLLSARLQCHRDGARSPPPSRAERGCYRASSLVLPSGPPAPTRRPGLRDRRIVTVRNVRLLSKIAVTTFSSVLSRESQMRMGIHLVGFLPFRRCAPSALNGSSSASGSPAPRATCSSCTRTSSCRPRCCGCGSWRVHQAHEVRGLAGRRRRSAAYPRVHDPHDIARVARTQVRRSTGTGPGGTCAASGQSGRPATGCASNPCFVPFR